AKFAKKRYGGFRAGRMSFASRVLLLLLLSSMVSTVTSQRLCGRRLTEALSVVCDHKYHRPTREQLNTVRTRSSGIATKCCRNRCPYEELSRVEKEATLEEAKAHKEKQLKQEEASKKPVVKRVGLGDALTMLAKRPKMSVLDKSNLDWKSFKQEQKID
ncbi:hypothetical protein PRIPAC_95190, partial [Pristionchus pacificus]|uniref:BCNT-C domain-containing protein n=1 Tax=Pristionchus pacificus TaxID=54126 RepID=A0A2A6D2P6_PRIPA